MKEKNILYKGFYNNILLCVSTSKKLIKEYLFNIRKIYNKDLITIEREYIINDIVFSIYEKYILDDCYGIYIPMRDIDIIDKDYELFQTKYIDNILYMKEYLKIIYPMLSKDEYNTILKSIEIFVKYQKKPKRHILMEEMFYMNHPIINMKLDDYIKQLKSFEESIMLDAQYHYIMGIDK